MNCIIYSAKVFEEEDFDPRDYGYVLTPDIANTKACYMLKETEDELMKKAKTGSDGTEVCSAFHASALYTCTSISRVDHRRACQLQGIQAIIHRLRFLRLFLQALTALLPSKSVSPTEQEMNEITRLLNNAVDLVPLIKRTVALGTQPDSNADAPNPMGFSPTVNQRILPPTFPRYTKIKGRDITIAFLEELVQRTKQACKIIHCTNYHSALVSAIRTDFGYSLCPVKLKMLPVYTVRPSPPPTELFHRLQQKVWSVPAVAQHSAVLVFPAIEFDIRHNADHGNAARLGEIVLCANRAGPTECIHREYSRKTSVDAPLPCHTCLMVRDLSVPFQVKFCVDTFLKYCMNMYSFVMFVQICGYNRARQRDKLARLLDDFASLQDEAERVDTYLFELNPEENERRPYFSTWVLYHCLRAMSMYILSGLELELYSVHEYMYIYWYAFPSATIAPSCFLFLVGMRANNCSCVSHPIAWPTGICPIFSTTGLYRH